MSLRFVDSHPTFSLTYSLDGPLLTCRYSSWLRGSAETTLDLRTVSPYLGRARVRNHRVTRVFYGAGLAAFAAGSLSIDRVTDLLGDRWGLLAVGAVPLLLLVAAAVHPFRIEITRVNATNGLTLLDICRPRRSSPEFDRLLAGIRAAIPASDAPRDAPDSRRGPLRNALGDVSDSR